MSDDAISALPIGAILSIRTTLQVTQLLTIAAGVVATVYLHASRRQRKAIDGPLVAGINHFMLIVVNVSLVLVSACQFGAVSLHDISCALHSVLSTALVPICGSVFLVRGWLLAVQFARVHEQLRWMQVYQMAPAERAAYERRPLSLMARIDLWISSHSAVQSPAVLIVLALVFVITFWVPSVVIEVGIDCSHDAVNVWNDLEVWVFLGLAMILATKLRGKIDTVGARKELLVVAAVMVVFQCLAALVGVVEDVIQLDPVADAADLEDTYDVEVAFAFWYGHLCETFELLILVTVTCVVPAVRLYLHRRDRWLHSTSQAKLDQILNDRHLKSDFRDFLEREFSIENLTFYDSVKSLLDQATAVFASVTDDSVQAMESRIGDIYGDFIAESGRFQVNLPNDDRRGLQRAVEELLLGGAGLPLRERIRLCKVCLAALTKAQATIFQLMANDSLPRFLRDRGGDVATVRSGFETIKSSVPSTAVPVSMKLDSIRL